MKKPCAHFLLCGGLELHGEHTHTQTQQQSVYPALDPSAPEFFLPACRDRNFVPGLLEMDLPWLSASLAKVHHLGRHCCKPARVLRDA